MKFAEAELRQITEETWRIVLGEELDGCLIAGVPIDIKDSIAACAQITGDWQLAVVLQCPIALARHVATIMFGTEQENGSPEDIQDAMCELINIIAGNIKGVLSGSSHLSLPNLVKGQDFKLMFPRHILLSEAGYLYEGQPLLVKVLGKDSLATRLQNSDSNEAA